MSQPVTIDGREYPLESLSDDVKAQLISMQFVDGEIQRLQAKLAAMQTARNAYAQAINAGLPPSADALSFN